MSMRYLTYAALAAFIILSLLNLSACSLGSARNEKYRAKKIDQAEPVEEEVTPPIVSQDGDPPPADYVDPAVGYDGDPGADADRLVLDLAERLWGKDSAIKVIVRDEKFRSENMWLWSIELGHGDAPMARGQVRLDMGYVDVFDAYSEFAPLAVSEGSDLPDLAVKALGLNELGYKPQKWLSPFPGIAIYRKHVDINGNNVSVGHFMIRFVTDTGEFIGTHRKETSPLKSFELNINKEDALKVALGHLEGTDDLPSHIDLVQIQDAVSEEIDTHVYWEFKFLAGYVYVRTDDASIAVSELGMEEPILF